MKIFRLRKHINLSRVAPPDRGTHAPNPHHALSEKIRGLLDAWRLDPGDRLALLGIADGGAYTAADGMLPDNPHTLARAEQLLAVQKALHERFRERPHYRDRWVGLSHPRLCGRTPLEVMQQGGPTEMRLVCAILRGQATDCYDPDTK